MVESSTKCENCAHSKVCSIKDQLKEAKNKVLNDFGEYGELIKISVSCTQWMSCFHLIGETNNQR